MRVNDDIKRSPVMLVGETTEVVPLKTARDRAAQADRDLVEVSMNGETPVVKIMDYGKLMFEQSKKPRSQHTPKLHEVQLTPLIDVHDFNVKIRKAIAWIEGRHKVQVVLKVKGRQKAHMDLARSVLDRFAEGVPTARIESITQTTMMLVPQ